MLPFATSRWCRCPAHLACLRLRLRLHRLNLESVSCPSCLTTIPLQVFTAQCHDNTPQSLLRTNALEKEHQEQERWDKEKEGKKERRKEKKGR